jgi:hypothetical protein
MCGGFYRISEQTDAKKANILGRIARRNGGKCSKYPVRPGYMFKIP